MQSNLAKPIPAFDPTRLRKLFLQIQQTEAGCWEWQGQRDHRGYGLVGIDYATYRVHRILYSHFVGALDPELVIDHLCRNTSCCNPFHLEQVESGENVLRGESLWARNARKQACSNGHEFTLGNTHFDENGTRSCRQCGRERAQAKRGPRVPKTHCKWGHLYTPENTILKGSTGARNCRTCAQAAWKANDERRRVLREAERAAKKA